MKKFYIYLGLTFLFLIAGCAKNRYINKEVVAVTKTHQAVAILPVEVETTGRLPKDLSAKQIQELERAESELFQDIILSAIQKSTRRGKTPYWVQFMSNQETTARLGEEGLDLEDTFNTPPSDLAQILGVDAVVRADVKKTRYMSDEASAIISVSEDIINIISDGPIFLPSQAKRTYTVDMQLELVNAEDGTALYNRNIDLDINYRNRVDDAIDKLSKRIGRFFPYKEHKLAKEKDYN